MRQILGRPGEVWLPESGADKLVVIRERGLALGPLTINVKTYDLPTWLRTQTAWLHAATTLI